MTKWLYLALLVMALVSLALGGWVAGAVAAAVRTALSWPSARREVKPTRGAADGSRR